MLTRYLHLLALAVFAAALPAAAHHVDEGSSNGVSASQSLTADETLSGAIDELVVIDQVKGQTQRYPILRQADGNRVALRGEAVQALTAGARVTVSGAKTGVSFTVTRVVSQTAREKSAPAPTARVEGRFMVAHSDDFEAGTSRFIYQVFDDAGGVTEIDLPFLPSALGSTMRVVVEGSLAADGKSVIAGSIAIESGATAASAPVTTNYLVIPIKFPNADGTFLNDPFTAATLNTSVFGSLPTKSAKEYYKEASYGQQLLSGVTADNGSGGFLKATVVKPATCDISYIANAAEAAATARGYNVASYTGILYVFNNVTNAAGQGLCGWAGLAYVGYARAYANNTSALWVIGHELGHNFGLLHAGSLNCTGAPIGCGAAGSVAEYGDPFNTMGNSGNTGHFDATQKDMLGWIAPSTVKTHAGGTATYQLSPIETGGQSAYAVKIPTTNANRTYWIEYRQPVGTFDAFIVPPNYPNAGAQIRIEYPFEKSSGSDDTEILDMTPATQGNFHDAALLAGAPAFVDPSTNVTINVLSATPGAAGLLTVQVTTAAGAPSTTMLTSSPNPSNPGAGVTFTATVTGLVPTGTVSFTNGGVSIAGCASAAVSGSGNSRTAACFTSSLTSGTHSIVATYSGDAGNAPSLSAPLSQVVKSASTTTLASSLNPSASGASVTFTATVTGTAPTGTINFRDGATSLTGCSAVALTGSGNTRTAACSTSSLSIATHSITAAYGGDSGNAASTSSALSQVVQGAATPTTTTVSSSLNPSGSGANVTFTATVTGTAPTGSVNFKDGATSLTGCSAVALAGSGNSRTATCATATLSVATHSITASYGGNAGNLASASAVLSQVVTGGSSINVALASNGGVASASSTYVVSMFPVSAVNNGDRAGVGFAAGGVWIDGTVNVFPDWVQINFSGSKTIDHVIVYSMQDNSSSPIDPPANMTFTLNGLTDFQVQGWNGSAWVTLGSVSGNNLVKRTVNFVPTVTDRIRVMVTSALAGYSRIAEIEAWTSGGGGPAATTTTLASSLNPSASGASVTFTATVTGVAPTGTINFKDGATSLTGCSAVALTGSGNTRTAACSTSSLSVATHSITAAYGGDAGNSASTSGALSQVVQGGATPTTTTVASSLNPSTSGANVTFTATVTGTAPTGTVNFKDGATSLTGCSAVALTGSGNSRTAACSSATLSVATHSIVASYSGDAANVSSASATLSQVVNSGGGGQINVALASNGGVATASSTFVASLFPVSAVNNGNRAGTGFAAGGVWVDGTANVFPDWVQINFSGSKTIDHVIVYSMQDNSSSPIDPPANMTFTLNGLTDFQVQGWNGSAWVTLGSVSGNNLVKRTVNFVPTVTDRIRVMVTSALAGYSRIAEIEAWGN